MAIAAFWLAVAAFIVASALNSRRGYELKVETIRMLLEKGQTIDDALLREVLVPRKWHTPPVYPVGHGYRVMRVIGTIVLCGAPGISLLLGVAGAYGNSPTLEAVGIAGGLFAALIGIGLHVATRFLPRPQPEPGSPKA